MRPVRVWLKRLVFPLFLLILLALAIRYHRALFDLVSDQERIQTWLAGLGPWGPLGLIIMNAAQVVVAPVPGYFLQITAGYLFGWLPGAIYGALGMALGGALAMGLARIFGRPLVRRVVGEERLDRWEGVMRVNSLGIWFIIMLGPFGDIPYFIAGLTRLAIWKIVAIALLVRGPSITVAAAVGSGVVSWRSPWVIGGAFILMTLGLIGVLYQDRIERWLDKTLLSRALALRQQRAIGSSKRRQPPSSQGCHQSN